MPTFEEQYKELFGEDLTYDPIKSSGVDEIPTPRLSLPGRGAMAPDATDGLDALRGELTGAAPTPDVGFPTAVGRSLKAGLADVGALGVGAGEYFARQFEQRGGSPRVRQMASELRQGLTSTRQGFEQSAQDIMSTLTPDQQDKAQRMIFSLDPDQTIWQGNPLDVAGSLALKLARMAPPSLTTLVGGAVLTRIGLNPAAVAYMGGSEAVMSLGGIQNAIADEVEATPVEQLVQDSPEFAAMIERGVAPDVAKQQLISDAQGSAPVIGGLVVGAISAVTGRYLQPVFEGGAGGVVSRFGRGYAAEAPQEASQGAAEQLMQNVAAQSYDRDRDRMEGVWQQGLEEGALGGLFGGGVSALGGHGPAHEPPPRATPTPTEEGPPAATFPEVFGEGAPIDTATGQIGIPGIEPGGPVEAPPTAEELEAQGQQRLPFVGPTDFMGAGQQRAIQFGPREEQGQLPLTGVTELPDRGGVMIDQIPDIPTAEPAGDIEAQLIELMEPTSPRQGVYLSADNLQRLDPGVYEGVGVPIPNFDGNGGTLIAKDEATAKELTGMLTRGVDMQTVLGLATGAGGGKALGSSVAVQRRDASGNVLQESLVSEAEAGPLQQQWQNDFPNDEIVTLSPDEVIARREGRISEEAQARTGDIFTGYVPQVKPSAQEQARRQKRRTQRKVAEEATEAMKGEQVVDVNVEGATTPARAAARVLAEATRRAKAESGRRVGGFFPVSDLNFDNAEQRVRYQKEFDKLVTAELTLEEINQQYKGEERPQDIVRAFADATNDRAAARQELAKIRTIAQPRRKAERYVRAAEAVSPGLGQALKQEEAAKRTPKTSVEEEITETGYPKEDATELFQNRLTPETVSRLKGKTLDDIFFMAAQLKAGAPKATSFIYDTSSNEAGAGPDSDEEIVSRFRSQIETLPEGAEPLAIQTAREKATKGGRVYEVTSEKGSKRVRIPLEQNVELRDITPAGKSGGWRYTLEQGDSTITGVIYAPVDEAKQQINSIVERHNASVVEPGTKIVQTFEQLLRAHKTPGMKRRLINRVISEMRKRKFGGRTKGPKLTRAAKNVKGTRKLTKEELKAREKKGDLRQTETVERAESTAYFDTDVLTNDVVPRDESVENRAKRMRRAKGARSDLGESLAQARDTMDNFAETEFADQINETDNLGNPTQDALDLMIARMYFRQVADFGEALLNSDINSASALRQMERVTGFLNSGISMDPAQFAKSMKKLADAEARQSIVTKPVKGDKKLSALKAELADPKTRRITLDKYNAKLRQATARMFRSSKVWRKNDLFNAAMAPVMERISASVLEHGWPKAVADMTQAELEGVKWALDNWNKNDQVKRGGEEVGTFRDLLYKPLKRYFGELGFEFDKSGSMVIPLNEDGKFETPLKTLEKYFRAKNVTPDERAELQPERRAEISEATRQLQLARTREAGAKALEREGLLADIEREGKYRQINRIIQQFRDRVGHPRITVQGLIRQEQRLIRAFKELGIWQDTPSAVIGKITHPGTNVTKSVSIAGPRLEAKKLSKDKARKLMLNLTKFQLPKLADDIAQRVEERAKQQLNAETEMFLDMAATTKHGDAFLDVAVNLRTQLNDNTFQTGHELLDTIIEGTPEGHPYNEIARRMRALAPADIAVRWAGKAQGYNLALDSFGRFRAAKDANIILLNKAAFEKLNADTDAATASAAMIHTTLHELVHATTTYALRNDNGTRSGFEQMRTIARRYMREIGREYGDIYGLRDKDPIEEFVAEAFSNTQFQAMLKEVPVQRETLWNKLISWLKNVLDLNVDGAENMLDMVMATADRVFSDTAFKGRGSFFMRDVTDPVAKTYVSYGKNLVEAAKFRAIAARKWAGIRAPLGFMTMGQIRTEFRDRLAGLDEYYRAFKRRDARNSELMEVAEKLSRKWTGLTQEHGAQAAMTFSEINSLATVHDVHPDVPLTHEKNKHIKEQGQKDAHAMLRKEFEALPQGFKGHWSELQNYYRESLEREAVLLTQNALRAILTSGQNAPYTIERFESEWSKDRISEMASDKDLTNALTDLLDPEQIATVIGMRTLPKKRTGPYSPLMRYGDYVVEASKALPTKQFQTVEEAKAWRSARLAEDPTLEIKIDGTTAIPVEKAFHLAESATEAQLKRDELVEEYGEENVTPVTLKVDYGQASTIQSNNALVNILNKLEGNKAAQSAIKQYYLRTLSDASFRKHEIKRKLRRGYDSKVQHRNFTNYATAASYYTAQLEHGWQMERAMRTMAADRANVADKTSREGVRKSEVFKEIQKRDERTSDPMVVSKLIRNVVSFGQFTMLTSPSYWMINATQPYMVSLPYMAAKHSYGSVMRALGKAQKLVGSPLVSQAIKSKIGLKALWDKMAAEEAFSVFDDVVKSIRDQHSDNPARAEELIDMLEALRRESILDLSWIAELRDIAEGSSTSRWQKVLDASRIMSHLTEVNNRIMTAVAAYDLARTTGSIEEAQEYAKDVVATTHFDYSSGSKPRWFRPDGPLGAASPLVFQFMQWPQHMYALLISNMVRVFKKQGVERKEAARILGGIIGTHMLAGGIIGTMLQPLKWAFGLAMMALGDDDEPYTFETAMSGEVFDRYVQEGLAELVGPSVAEAVSRGVPAALGSDLSDRMSLGTLYFMDLRPDSMESTLGSALLSVGGPWLTIGESGFRAAQDLFNGEVLRGVERVSPKAVRDLLKTYRYATEGLVNNAGDTVLDGNGVPPFELFLQSIGFSSAEVSNFYNRQAIIKDTERYGTDRQQALVNRFVRAEDNETRARILQEVTEFNRAFPAEAITRSTLVRAIRGRHEREASFRRHGANLRGKAQVYADEGWFYE